MFKQLAITVTALLVLGLTTGATRQLPLAKKTITVKNFFSQERVRTAFPGSVAEPAPIVSVTVRGIPVVSGRPFIATDEWLKHIRVTVRNNAEQDLTYACVQLTFPPHDGASPTLELALGQTPFRTGGYSDSPAAYIEPGKLATIDFRSQRKDGYEKFIEYITAHGLKLSDLDSVEIHPIYYGFEDGSCWSWGKVMRPDPAHPGEWLSAKVEAKTSEYKMLKASTRVPLCWDLVNPPNPRVANCSLANCPSKPPGSCQYGYVPIIGAEQGANRKPTSPICYEVSGAGNPCGCCQTGVQQLDLNSLCGF